MSSEINKKYRKISDFTHKLSANQKEERPSYKHPISPTDTATTEREAKLRCLTLSPKATMDQSSMISKSIGEANPTLQDALGPLVNEFKLLRESVDTVHNDSADLKTTISMQKEEIKQELSNKIEDTPESYIKYQPKI